MPNLIDSIKAEADRDFVDLRKDAPDLLAKLGIDTSDEHQIFHAVLLFLVKAAQAGVATEVKEFGL